MIDYCGRAPSRQKLLNGVTPDWVRNNSRGSYIAQVLLSCLPWVDRWELYALQATARAITIMMGELYVLDHIVPLNGHNVCGLTVPWNIRIIHWRVNASKGAKFNPDQLELFDEHCDDHFQSVSRDDATGSRPSQRVGRLALAHEVFEREDRG